MIDVSAESMLAINFLGCHQSSISPLPVHAMAGPVFIKQNKYQILIYFKCCIREQTFIKYIKYIPYPSTTSASSIGAMSTAKRSVMKFWRLILAPLPT